MNHVSKDRGHPSNDPPVTMYSSAYCGFCISAKRLLGRLGIPFEEIDLTHDHDQRERLSQRFGGYRTVPMIVVEGRFIGGFRELSAMERAGALDHLVGDRGAARSR